MTKPTGVWALVSVERSEDFPPSEEGYACWLVTVHRVRPEPSAVKSQFIMARDRLAALMWVRNNYNLETPLAWALP